MLLDTWNKKKKAELDEAQWRASAPAAYQSGNAEAIGSALAKLGTGFDWNTGSDRYLQRRSDAVENAAKAAENTRAQAAALTGGYGSSWADSVAAQGQREALAGVDDALPELRAQALAEYQNQQNGLLGLLSGLANSEKLDQSAYQMNWNNWLTGLNVLENASSAAQYEHSSALGNVGDFLQGMLQLVTNAYDGAKGYRQQTLQNQQSALATAIQYKAAGLDTEADWLLQSVGLDPALLTAPAAGPGYSSDQLSLIGKAADLYGMGAYGAGDSILAAAGMDAGMFDDYKTQVQRQNEAALAKLYASTRSGSGSASRAGTGSGIDWTGSQVMSAADSYYKAVAAGNAEEAAWYRAVLDAAGYPVAEEQAGSGAQAGTSSGVYTPPTVAKRGNEVSSVNSRKVLEGVALAQEYKNSGYNDRAVVYRLRNKGYTDEQIAQIMEKAGF